MKLHSMYPSDGSRKLVKSWRGTGSGLGKLVVKVTKGKMHVVVVELDQVLKVVNYHYSDVTKRDLVMLNSKWICCY